MKGKSTRGRWELCRWEKAPGVGTRVGERAAGGEHSTPGGRSILVGGIAEWEGAPQVGARGQRLLSRQNPNGSPPRRIPPRAVLGTAGAPALSLAPLGFTCGLGLGGRAADPPAGGQKWASLAGDDQALGLPRARGGAGSDRGDGLSDTLQPDLVAEKPVERVEGAGKIWRGRLDLSSYLRKPTCSCVVSQKLPRLCWESPNLKHSYPVSSGEG